MVDSIILPEEGGTLKTYTLSSASPVKAEKITTFQTRTAYSAAHVVADPFAKTDPVGAGVIDWEQTLSYRHYLWSMGLGVAEAMDTAQRGMGLAWEQAQELITRSVREANLVGGRIACGVGTDQLAPGPDVGLDDVIKAYEEQCEQVEKEGGQLIIMASRALARAASSPTDYEYVYRRILQQVKEPVILHWLGDMFDPNLKGYWGHEDLDQAMDVCLRIIRENEAKVDGIKISLLDKNKEITMRRLLPSHVNMYTGDDFNYPELIHGDEKGYSDALLGIFDAIAPAASAAIQALDNGDVKRFHQILDPTVPLARHIFEKPTYFYKTGVVFMAYLNGHQDHFKMIGGAESGRPLIHLSDLFQMADQAGLLLDRDLAVERMSDVLRLAGVKQGVQV
ncbi:dihydrodipicolinate synthase family protein [Salsuginibacillus kocurii]|uniref:dihydrodipicolinate synthase family protein n=1 Tax=Salsuginibacillus kocurii TaxID=427078 RepID=UPI000371C473|nr:dihydrodipicolinate synthase family protein [Salsuginibacillus kocurii]